MSRHTIPLTADDLSRFTRALAQQMTAAPPPHGHLSLMNMLARAAGFRNVQHLRAAHLARARLEAAPPPETADHRLVERALFQFDAAGLLLRWPSRRPVQELCLWARLPPATVLDERAVSALLRREHRFEDPAILRRSLTGMKLVARSRDGSAYRRQERRPPAEARELVRILSQRRGSDAS
ncbi:hypothetical protein DK427_03030 [Methylobacterium radiodurans]|uniref:DUF2087 domain-containing protein n=2 Tax=Methylobacterium radiodurans TaxID=2202828 RepID=A0A2U8VMZ2_9HYPH|nr:hypothetical protein DK427_03030 [Methylobacterium radiodurans]